MPKAECTAATGGRFRPLVLCSGLGLLLGGCSTPEYPAELTYPLRTDWLVEQAPPTAPTAPEESGKMDAEIARLQTLGGKVHNPAGLTDAQRARLERALRDAFGIPAAPTISGDEDVRTWVAQLGVSPDGLPEGSRLFRRHCLQCHGLTGDGRGPTGPWIYPHPRDYRQGVFKWTTSGADTGGRPRRADLLRTVRNGIEGSSMPKFGLLPEEDQQRLVDYVIHLSLRGEVEYRIMLALLADGEAGLDGEISMTAQERLKGALRQWVKAAAAPPAPAVPTPDEDDARTTPEHLASVRRGHELFTASPAAACITCHEDFGRKARPRYDVWGTQVRPAELTERVYRGGRRPEDLYWRIRGGVYPSGMPTVGALRDEEVWDLVHFVQALPYPRMLPEDVREKVYPPRDRGRRAAEK